MRSRTCRPGFGGRALGLVLVDGANSTRAFASPRTLRLRKWHVDLLYSLIAAGLAMPTRSLAGSTRAFR